MLQALQDTVNQILTVGHHNGSNSLFHMSCHGLLERGHPSIVFATQFAAQLVSYKIGEVARYRQLACFHGTASHAHRQGARGYWFESLAHQVLADGGKHTFNLVDELYLFSCNDSTWASLLPGFSTNKADACVATLPFPHDSTVCRSGLC